MIKKIMIGLLILSCSSSVFSQLKELTLTDAIMGGYSKFRPSTLSQLSWMSTENSTSWVTKDSLNPRLVKRAIDSKAFFSLVDLEGLKSFEELKDLKKFPRIKWSTATLFYFNYKGIRYSYDYQKKELNSILSLNKKGQNTDYSPDNKNVAYTIENNLWVGDNQITNDSLEGVINGQSVHRFEFGIYKGTFWSNNNQMLAFYRKDESMVSGYPLANYTTKPASATPVKYPMAGMKSHEVTLGVWNNKSNKIVWIKTGEPKEQYLTNIAWSPDDKSIFIAVLNRNQNEMKLNEYDPKTGEFVKTLFVEKDANYVQPLHPMEFLPNDASQFVWQSERDGYNNLYLYSTKGKLISQLTKHTVPITSMVKIHDNGLISYMVADNKGMDRILYQVNVKDAKSSLISKESGVHKVIMSNNGMYYIDYFNNISTRLNVGVFDNQGEQQYDLMKNENPYKDLNVRLPELGKLTTNEGIELNTRIFKPFDFEPNKKYKALVYVYNGPGVQLITNSWMAGAPAWMPYFANKGYIIFTVDGRGSENRGRDFEQAVFRKLGELEIVDQLSGVDYLSGLDYVNADKIAVHGWSYGGFMTTSLMLKTPGIFQVGVAGGPVMDWKYYEIMYTERYMDTPEANEAGYARASLLDKVQNLKGDLLIIHGADDDVVVPQHSVDFIKNSVDKGVQVDFFLYPGHKHNVRGKDRIHLMRKVLDYIDEKME
ncbi:MAG: DPP IV N-terminal domain-containing protein [Flavobacteriales bacterium]|jgi:dipeptidyl-peptidase-4|tara:strand:+ start:5694 stop:7823 length:2130 start_codon:yes stop_codon:yes gene_type:complete